MSAATFTIALIGNPNTGKSTLFNTLTGMRARVGNFPGVTVEKKVGRVRWEGTEIDLVDLPGTYSLAPKSLDEMVTIDVLLGRQEDIGKVDAVVCVVDASNLERNLYLVSQVLSLEAPVVLALNMSDVARSRGMAIDTEQLSQRLGVNVVETQGHRQIGLDDLRQAILKTAQVGKAAAAPIVFPEPFRDGVEELRKRMGDQVPRGLVERLLIDRGGELERELLDGDSTREKLNEIRQRLAEQKCTVPAIEARSRYAWIRQVLDGVLQRPDERPLTPTDRLDAVLTHRIAGLATFILVMAIVFQAIGSWAGPLMDIVEAGQEWIASSIESVAPPGAFRSLVIDGIVAGVGSVLVFTPQIAILFFFIALLEDCGYMARAAFLMDRLMTKVGLSGKSFVPLMSSFACAIPGIMATRVIENRRDRMVTILIAPLMSCSARLPVYVLLIYTFIPDLSWANGWISLRTMVLLGMTFLGLFVALPVAWLLKRFFFPGQPAPLVMELPDYKVPTPRIVLHRAYDRTLAFVTRAGSLIFATTILIWGAGYFPGDHTQEHQLEKAIVEAEGDGNQTATEHLAAQLQQTRATLLRNSLLGRMGHAVEPVVEPLGWDWRIGVGAIASFPAREVIIATLGTIYSLGGDVDEEDPGLKDAMRSAKWPDGRPVFNIPVALSILVFFALCAQCGATLMVIYRETNHWGWPVFTFAYMTTLAYLGALIVYQVSSRMI